MIDNALTSIEGSIFLKRVRIKVESIPPLNGIVIFLFELLLIKLVIDFFKEFSINGVGSHWLFGIKSDQVNLEKFVLIKGL